MEILGLLSELVSLLSWKSCEDKYSGAFRFWRVGDVFTSRRRIQLKNTGIDCFRPLGPTGGFRVDHTKARPGSPQLRD